MKQNKKTETPQYGLGKILLMFAWPAAWYFILIYVIGVRFIPAGGGTPTWVMLAILALGPCAEMVAGLVLLRYEGYELNISSLRDRIHWRWPKGLKAWVVVVVVFIIGMSLSMLLEPANKALASVPGFVPPSWWPAGSNPTVEVNGVADAFPDVAMEGNFLFVLVYFLIGMVFNIFGEEIYYRGFLLPKMHGVFGSWDWVANGVLFTLKHAYQRWLYPGILSGALAFAFAFGPLGSLPLAMLYHWVGNFLFQMVFLVMAALGLG
jgi:membrane protease YdiL (CAAX protease family)